MKQPARWLAVLLLGLPPLEAAQEKTTVAVVGGTTFGDPASFGKGLVSDEGSFTVETNAGTSPPIHRLRFKGTPLYYVRLHGVEGAPENEPPGWNMVRTFAALHQLGVTHAFGGATCGGINPAYDYDDLVVVDDFILIGNQRPQSILRAARIERPGIFPSFAVPFCPDLRRLLLEEARRSYPGRVHASGVMLQDDPGRFETPAEVRMMRALGGDMVSHNVVSEAIYARQLGIHFALLNSISNPATGVRPFSFEDMQDSVARISARAVPIVLEALRAVSHLVPSCGTGCVGESYRGSYTKKETTK
jgi:5'-methylthioadenosine phosphorylase